jgi:hypothetical protein
MNADRVFSILGAIVGVAAITTVVAHPQSAAVIKSMGAAFTNSLKAAMGS